MTHNELEDMMDDGYLRDTKDWWQHITTIIR